MRRPSEVDREVSAAIAWLGDLRAGKWPRGRELASKQARVLERIVGNAGALGWVTGPPPRSSTGSHKPKGVS